MRQRAAVLIGVRRTGGLPLLQAVDDGVQQIRAWVESQPGFREDEPIVLMVDGHDEQLDARVVTLTDAAGPVTASDVRKWIRAFVDLGTVEQLIVYFAGHGVNLRFGEYWLLSGAPEEANEAVNLRGSADLARYCGIPHVVFISDACRTAADSIQAQVVEGSLVFPNAGLHDQPGCVDIFYASMVGRPSLEVRDANAAAGAFRAVYTEALVTGLSGARPELVEALPTGEVPPGRVRPWPLKRYLQTAVPMLLTERGVAASQKPDAVITSEPEEWLAAVEVAAPADAAPGRTRPTRGPARRPGRGSQPPGPQRPAPTLVETAQATVSSVLRGLKTGGPPSVVSVLPERQLVESMYARIAGTPAPGHFETRCGFKVTGIGVASAESAGAKVELLSGPAGLVRVHVVRPPAADVLLVFDDGRGALLPAIPNFVAGLTYDAHAGELASVEYEPSDNTPQFKLLASRLSELRELRRVVASMAALGVFRLDERDDRNALLQRLRDVKGLDPSMSVYAAYALHDTGQRAEIAELAGHLLTGTGIGLFDVSMLARRRTAERLPLPTTIFPAVPLLSQGWALLDAHTTELRPPLLIRELRRHVTHSLWTLFDAEGVARVRAALLQDTRHTGEP